MSDSKGKWCVLMVVVGSLGVTGCESGAPSKVYVHNNEFDLGKTASQGRSESEPPAAPETSALAAQSQRDVEAILKARAAAKDRPPASPSSESSAAESQSAKTIVWNETQPRIHPREARQEPPKPQPSASTAAADKPAPPPAASSSTPAALEPDRLKKLVVDLSRELYATGAYSHAPLRELLVIASMSMIDPQRRLDPQAIPDLSPPERELLGKLQAFFVELGTRLDGKSNAEQAILEAISKLRESLVKEPILKLPTLALATRVGGFGDFSCFDKNSFLAGSEQKAIVYIEIADFTSELNQKNEYVTELAQQLTIYSDRDGIPVWKEDWQTAVDKSKNKRQDFFTVQVITIPKALSVGKYQLKVRVRDQKSHAEAEGTIAFEMVADPRMAASFTGK
jgi:hypothetical protein